MIRWFLTQEKRKIEVIGWFTGENLEYCGKKNAYPKRAAFE